MRAIRSMEIQERDSGLALAVVVFSTTRSLNIFRSRASALKQRCAAFYLSYGKLDVKKGGTYGCIAFAEDNLSEGVVAHEMFHAVHDLYKRRYANPGYRDRKDIEECMATEIGELVNVFWDWWHRRCPKRYTIKFSKSSKEHRFLPANAAAKT